MRNITLTKKKKLLCDKKIKLVKSVTHLRSHAKVCCSETIKDALKYILKMYCSAFEVICSGDGICIYNTFLHLISSWLAFQSYIIYYMPLAFAQGSRFQLNALFLRKPSVNKNVDVEKAKFWNTLRRYPRLKFG